MSFHAFIDDGVVSWVEWLRRVSVVFLAMNEMDYPSSSFLPSSYQEYVHTDLPPEAVNEVFIRTTTLREGAQEAHGLAAEDIVLLVADVLPGFNLVLHHTLAVVGVADGRELVLAVRSFRSLGDLRVYC